MSGSVTILRIPEDFDFEDFKRTFMNEFEDEDDDDDLEEVLSSFYETYINKVVIDSEGSSTYGLIMMELCSYLEDHVITTKRISDWNNIIINLNKIEEV